MDGILILDKPAGPTSHDMVARARKIFATKRVGHTGTLDPFATGVLVLLIGQATRLLQFLEDDEKEYEARVRFGFETDTADLTGKPIGEAMPEKAVAARVRQTDWNAILSRFRGSIEQVPPMYSAKKISGKKLYELARQGLEVERKPIKIDIPEIEISLNDPTLSPTEAFLRVRCSAGTYVRTLAEDIGRVADLGAHLVSLRRTRAGRFELKDAVSLDNLLAAESPEEFLKPMNEAVGHFPVFELTDTRIGPTLNGMPTRVRGKIFVSGEWVRLTDRSGRLLAMAKYDETENMLRPKIVFI